MKRGKQIWFIRGEQDSLTYHEFMTRNLGENKSYFYKLEQDLLAYHDSQFRGAAERSPLPLSNYTITKF